MSEEMTSKILRHLSSAGPLANVLVSNKEADEVMLQTGGTIFARGILYDIKYSKASPGTCKLTLERAN